MEYIINSRIFGKSVFYMNQDGYVFLEINEGANLDAYEEAWKKPDQNAGILLYSSSHNVCKGGRLSGEQIKATPETFRRVCRSWQRQRIILSREEF